MALKIDVLVVLGYKDEDCYKSVSVPMETMKAVAVGEMVADKLSSSVKKAFVHGRLLEESNGDYLPSPLLLFKVGLGPCPSRS